jgi:hypothetical protein
MLYEGAQQRFIIADHVGGQLGLHHKIVKRQRCEVRQRVGPWRNPKSVRPD